MFNKSTYIKNVLLICYIGFVLWLTIFSRTPMNERIFRGLFWELRNRSWMDIFLNILLFVPIGFLTGDNKWILFGFLLSLFIEVVQYCAIIGYSEADDVLHNTMGIVIGYYLRKECNSMLLKHWNDLPDFMKCDEVEEYYVSLRNKRASLVLKRLFDIIAGLLLIIILAIPMIVIAIFIKIDSRGPVFYRQERITTYGHHFKIHKFRTMVSDADKMGTAVTVNCDSRITKVGLVLRHYRLDEIPQLFDVISGNMSFVGTRPEVAKYVGKYKPEYLATLLLPAGITSEASIRYKDEARLLDSAKDIDKVYVEEILPGKMTHNLKSIKEFSFLGDIATMVRTVCAVLGKNYE